MPSAPAHLCAKFPGGDEEALRVLVDRFDVDRTGMIRPKFHGLVVAPREAEAIDYLWLEWDYGYSPMPLGSGGAP